MKFDFIGGFIVTCFLVMGIMCARANDDKENFLTNSRIVARMIYENRREGEACKELNMNMYIWLRSQGLHPDVQIGIKEGQGHLWLELDGRIIDVTDPTYYGKLANDLHNVYILSELEQIKE